MRLHARPRFSQQDIKIYQAITMKTNPLKQGTLTENSEGIGTVTPKIVHARAAELAVIDGRSVYNVTTSDLAQAKQELTGEPKGRCA
jgi:hypothetical protein